MQSRDQIASEQVRIVYDAVTSYVIGGTLLAVSATLSIDALGHPDAVSGAAWTIYIAACSAGQVVLSRLYRRSPTSVDSWRRWALWLVAFSTAAGTGWGWASIHLATGADVGIASLVIIATFSVVAGAIPGFSTYFPAFIAFLLPATIPYIGAMIISPNAIQQATAPMMLLIACVVGYLGRQANRAATQNIRLRFSAERTAGDLQMQNERIERLAVDLRCQRQIADEANLAKSQFLAAASHDLRQSAHALNLLIGALHSIPLPSEGQRLVERIERSSDALSRLFGALLDLSRLDAGSVEARCRPFAIDTVLEYVCNDCLLDAQAKGITLTRMPCRTVVHSDPVLLERIVRNLVSNAVRYTDRGKIVVGCRRRGTRLAIQVWDTGCGIPEHLQKLVFHEYYQIGNAERDHEKGFGLGLAIVRRLAALLECQLSVHSEPGRGSCFEVAVALATRMPDPLDMPLASHYDVPASTGLVVVIDGNRVTRTGLSELLATWGYETIAARSGKDALEQLTACARRPDLLICDYLPPRGENGIAVIERLRGAVDPALPALLISGDTTDEQQAASHAHGLVLLHRPLPNGKLRAAVGNLVAAGARRRSTADTDAHGVAI
ncbi:hybrid sensor histidine kinase/response regulator [Burkholderia cepacia]|uniref:ATP-binding response regulator n=1 Tax=Burkholderia cepacia TaxID=292 RepID=UPI000753C189|nr:hybrid sensor histidine kinase/response regulator [Burkholderia cepacia]KVL47746.1 hybrid sensor histidine kinase/response regulator [Burkholderia cepacia]